MPSVTITELKAHLSEYLRRAQAGEHLYVTSRGEEVAEIGPPDPVRAALWRMVADGEAEWSGAGHGGARDADPEHRAPAVRHRARRPRTALRPEPEPWP